MKTLGKIGKNNFARPDPDGRRGRPRTRSGSGSTWLEIPCNDVSSPKEFGQDFENHRTGRPKVEFCEFIHVFKRPLAKIELRSSTARKLSNTKTFPHDFRKITKPAPAFRKSWGKVFVVDSFRAVPSESYPTQRLLPRIFEKSRNQDLLLENPGQKSLC